jgi:hypothetical protein
MLCDAACDAKHDAQHPDKRMRLDLRNLKCSAYRAVFIYRAGSAARIGLSLYCPELPNEDSGSSRVG